MSRYGSLQNLLAANSVGPEPEVGMGATVCMWTDRHAATITEVLRYKSGPKAGQVKGVKTRACKAIRTDNLGMTDAQSYRFEEMPDAPESEWTLRKDGSFIRKGSSHTTLAIGYRDAYYDYSF